MIDEELKQTLDNIRRYSDVLRLENMSEKSIEVIQQSFDLCLDTIEEQDKQIKNMLKTLVRLVRELKQAKLESTVGKELLSYRQKKAFARKVSDKLFGGDAK